jgi:hypothetical protein
LPWGFNLFGWDLMMISPTAALSQPEAMVGPITYI